MINKPFVSSPLKAALTAGRDALRKRRPARYDEYWFGPFDDRIDPIARLRGVSILDVGSGRSPTIPADRRGEGCRYVGLDVSADELAQAPEGAYDDTVVSEAAEHVSRLENQFDLIVSFYVFEHIASLDQALEQLRTYLRPGGRLVAVFSGRYAAFGIINRALPDALGSRVVALARGRPRETVFPAYYTGCYHSALQRMLEGWGKREILPLWRGADYFSFARPLESVYLAYEEWAMRGERRNLAPYYLISATR